MNKSVRSELNQFQQCCAGGMSGEGGGAAEYAWGISFKDIDIGCDN